MLAITPFALKHQPGVVSVILPIQQAEFALPITLEEQPDLQDIPAFYQHGAGNFWVACAGDEVVGTVALLDIGQGEAALRKMFVKQAYRGAEHGVAAKLLATLLAWSRAQALRALYLGTTAKFLAAHRFYEKHGFSEITPAQLPPSFPIMRVDTKFYRLELGA